MMVISRTESAQDSPHKNRVHTVLAHSYLFHFVVFLFAFLLDFVFPLKIFEEPSRFLGPLLLLFGTSLIFWAQRSSHKLKKENMSRESFRAGPYRFVRCPTNLGIFLAMLGFGSVINSMFIVFFAVVSFLISKFTFIRKEERILAEKYGAPYLEYKKLVRF